VWIQNTLLASAERILKRNIEAIEETEGTRKIQTVWQGEHILDE
jgi:hypothetical protein